MGTDILKARIVIADDDAENARTVEQGLQADGHQTRVCNDGEAAFHLVKSWMPHILLLDVNMPKLTGLEVLKKVRAMTGGEYVAVILVTGNSGLDEIVMGLDAGADDYIVKPYRLVELCARVRSCLRVKNLNDALRRANKRLEDAACLDDLTALYNMRYVFKRLGDEVENTKKSKHPLSCIMFDMDFFKTVNDKNDHLFGSHVLREVAQVIQPHLRPTDVAARYGGDEFLVLMPNTAIKDAAELAERMRKALEAHTFKAGQASAKVTASFGVAGVKGSEDLVLFEGKELVRSADSALYAAKKNGRNRTEVYAFLD